MAMVRICEHCGKPTETQLVRVCDVCKAPCGETAYQFPVPAVLLNNDGREFTAADSSMTDVCERCAKNSADTVLSTLLVKAQG